MGTNVGVRWSHIDSERVGYSVENVGSMLSGPRQTILGVRADARPHIPSPKDLQGKPMTLQDNQMGGWGEQMVDDLPHTTPWQTISH